jgi:hypothetical protein
MSSLDVTSLAGSPRGRLFILLAFTWNKPVLDLRRPWSRSVGPILDAWWAELLEGTRTKKTVAKQRETDLFDIMVGNNDDVGEDPRAAALYVLIQQIYIFALERGSRREPDISRLQSTLAAIGDLERIMRRPRGIPNYVADLVATARDFDPEDTRAAIDQRARATAGGLAAWAADAELLRTYAAAAS